MSTISHPIPEPHPGEILLEEFIRPAGITAYHVAKNSGISQSTMTQLVNGKRGITMETALRLAFFFNTTPGLWLNLQRNYELRKAEAEILPRIQKEVRPLELA